jgi:hypothetical protein
MMAVETCASSVVAPYCMLLLLLPKAGQFVYIDLHMQVPVKLTPLRLSALGK